MWSIVYISSSQDSINKVRNGFEKEGVLLKVNVTGSAESKMYEILVPEGEVVDAHEIINEVIF